MPGSDDRPVPPQAPGSQQPGTALGGPLARKSARHRKAPAPRSGQKPLEFLTLLRRHPLRLFGQRQQRLGDQIILGIDGRHGRRRIDDGRGAEIIRDDESAIVGDRQISAELRNSKRIGKIPGARGGRSPTGDGLTAICAGEAHAVADVLVDALVDGRLDDPAASAPVLEATVPSPRHGAASSLTAHVDLFGAFCRRLHARRTDARRRTLATSEPLPDRYRNHCRNHCRFCRSRRWVAGETGS